MTKEAFPLTLEAVRAHAVAADEAESRLWAVGDALVTEVGPPQQ